MKVQKNVLVKVNIGDEIKAPGTIFREELKIFVCHIDNKEGLIYIDTEKNSPKNKCESIFPEDCYLV